MSRETAMTNHPSNTLGRTPSQCEAELARDRAAWTYQPEADVYERDDAFMIVLDMPGVTAGNIDLTADEHVLDVHGRVEPREAGENGRMVHREYAIGDYFRRFDLQGMVDLDGVSAECRNGVVTVYLPKRATARTKRIDVTGPIDERR